MKKRLFLTMLLIIAGALLAFFAGSLAITARNNLDMAKDSAMEAAQIYAGLYSVVDDASALLSVPLDTRLTIIAADGTVIADSRSLDLDALSNHLDRPEIIAALAGNPKPFVRYSESLGVDTLYYALKVEDGSSHVFIRTSIPVAKIEAYLSQSLPLLILLLLAVSFSSLYVSRRLIERIVAPLEAVQQKLRELAKGHYHPLPIVAADPEIYLMTREIDSIAAFLQQNMELLREEKEKAEFILDHIGDGLFVVDERECILLINAAACSIFGVTSAIVGGQLPFLTADGILTQAVSACVAEARASLLEINMEGRIYSASIKRLSESLLTLVVLGDITESRENAKRREEFFANASHELKTPLTAIRGMNDLTALHNHDEQLTKFIASMSREIDRMLILIGDMLRLSELENVSNIQAEDIAMAVIVAEVQEALAVQIEEKALVFTTSGEGVVAAEKEHLYELIKNLVENAVRYTDPGGKVRVSISGERRELTLSIIDSGIGISAEEQTRIFERFYRVEKSRSQRTGGTGLGLAIVKHICSLYDWKLSLSSKLGEGTEVRVVFRS